MKIGGYLYDFEQYKESLDCYEEAIQLNQNNVSAFSSKGRLYLLLENTMNLLKIFSKLLILILNILVFGEIEELYYLD